MTIVEDVNKVFDTSFICSYKQLDDDDLYRIQFMQAFRVDTWIDSVISAKTHLLCNAVKDHFKEIFDIMRLGKTRFTYLLLLIGNDMSDENLFRLLFCMDLFDETHACIRDILTNHVILPEHLNQLKQELIKQ
jgi:hypothetical protein